MSRKKPSPKVRKQIPHTTPGNPIGRVERMNRRAEKAAGREPPLMPMARQAPALPPAQERVERKRPGVMGALGEVWRRLHRPADR